MNCSDIIKKPRCLEGLTFGELREVYDYFKRQDILGSLPVECIRDLGQLSEDDQKNILMKMYFFTIMYDIEYTLVSDELLENFIKNAWNYANENNESTEEFLGKHDFLKDELNI